MNTVTRIVVVAAAAVVFYVALGLTWLHLV